MTFMGAPFQTLVNGRPTSGPSHAPNQTAAMTNNSPGKIRDANAEPPAPMATADLLMVLVVTANKIAS
jgi:hypothetical protein